MDPDHIHFKEYDSLDGGNLIYQASYGAHRALGGTIGEAVENLERKREYHGSG